MSKTGSGDDFWGVKPTPATEKGVPNHEKIDFLGGSKAHQRQKGVPKTVQTRGGPVSHEIEGVRKNRDLSTYRAA